MPTGAAIGGAGLGGSLISGLFGSNASKAASQQQQQMGLMALMQQQGMFGQAQNALNPFITAGQSVLPTLQSLLTPSTAASTLQTLPGFEFASKWGNLQATNALAAQGLGGSSGPLAKAISEYNNGLAQNTWGQAVSGLQNFANMGVGSANVLAGNAINAGNSMASTLSGIGNAGAAGTLGANNALTNAFSGGLNSLLFGALRGASSGGASGIYGSLSNLFGGGKYGENEYYRAAGTAPLNAYGPGF